MKQRSWKMMRKKFKQQYADSELQWRGKINTFFWLTEDRQNFPLRKTAYQLKFPISPLKTKLSKLRVMKP
jgi:hypothetical protein